MRRLVAMGRRMKISERFTSRLLAGLALLASSTTRALASVPNLNAASRGQAQLTLRDDRFTGLQTAVHHQLLIDASAGDDRPHLYRLVVFHNIDELPVLTGLH